MQYPTIAQPQYGFAPTMPMMPSMSDMPPAMMANGGSVANAQSVQSKGRGRDTMLVHMTPKEVGGLQALAMQHGGSLTINPQTGLPEAGFLESILPTLLGVGGMFLGIPPHVTAMAVGGIQAARTGDIGKGLMAGLGAYGGATMAGALGAGSAAAGAGGLSTAAPAATGAEAAAGAFTPDYALTAGAPSAASNVGTVGGGANLTLTPAASAPGLTANLAPATNVASAITPPSPSFMDKFAQAAAGPGGTPATYKTALAGSGLVTPFIQEPNYSVPTPKEEGSNYEGPYTPSARRVSYPGDDERRRTSEFTYFNPSNPVPFAEGGETAASTTTSPDVVVSPNEARVYQDILNVQRLAGLPAIDPSRFAITPGRSYEQFVYNPIESGPATSSGIKETDFKFAPLLTKADIEAAEAAEAAEKASRSVMSRMFGKGGGYATGGHVSVPQLENGGFVLTKKAVDGLGRGNNEKGQANAQRGLGAIPIRGAGAKRGPKAGVDDKIKTSIDGKRPALVSNGEAYVPKKQVAKKGGAKAFYALMKQAEKSANKRRRA